MKSYLYNKGLAISTAAASDRSSQSFKIQIGPQEVIEVERAVIRIYSTDVAPTVGFHRILAGISSADLETESSVVDGSSIQAFMNRNDIFVFSEHNITIVVSDGQVTGHEESIDFSEPIVLPRTPSLVMLGSLGGDLYICDCVIYYRKRAASQEEILKLMKHFKSIKPPTVPRVIDE